MKLCEITISRKTKAPQGFLDLTGLPEAKVWWRCRESNPGPKNLESELLHRYSVAQFNPPDARRTKQPESDPVKVSGCVTGVALPYPVVNDVPVVPPASSLGTPVKPLRLQECYNCRQLMPCRFIKVGRLPRPGATQSFNSPSKPLHPHFVLKK